MNKFFKYLLDKINKKRFERVEQKSRQGLPNGAEEETILSRIADKPNLLAQFYNRFPSKRQS